MKEFWWSARGSRARPMRANWRRRRQVAVIDRRPHIAGNAFDEVDSPESAATPTARIVPYQERARDGLAAALRRLHAVPAPGQRLRAGNRALRPAAHQRTTVNIVFGEALGDAGGGARVSGAAGGTERNAAQRGGFLNAKIGVELTDLLFRPYSFKMWGMQLEEMAAALVQRIPIRHDDEDRYFPTMPSRPAARWLHRTGAAHPRSSGDPGLDQCRLFQGHAARA